ncbi:hypothetical protein [Blastococcus goldschmidtiae]|uniref:Lipoprotein n=1 Tax=Blastococcus goldschmidtiae TaxID=3075546 RepID=A0ABU2KAB7_9ACTN|nr:hypothetical protein [Blastococcus sp. DSM 46792]MDT0277127.1 hypothetical protein [Blastococcus sp. DSM 46792]
MRRWAGLLLMTTLGAPGALLACSPDPVERVPPVSESGREDFARYRIEPVGDHPLAWVDGGDYLAVTIRGSSSCPRGPGAPTVTEPQHLTIDVVELRPDQEVCSADDAPHVTVVEVPDGLDPTRPVTAVLDWGRSSDDTTVTLAPPD